ncbi:MAG: 2-hydroxyacyl-CoA dehydratase [Chloroflexi bacterium]|nr:2-hydroxyacyl-CoA dehydratase [Chloroflexota bacterium]
MAHVAQPLWKTKPLDCWQKVKELRLNHYKEVATAKQDGKLLVSGSATWGMTVPAGLGDFVFLSGEPYGASVGFEPHFAQECAEASEARGLSRDVCAYMRNYWGSMFLDKYLWGGPFPRPDFYLTYHMCDSHAKWYQIASEHTGAPLFAIDWPVGAYGQNREARIKYVAEQTWDAIEWMEKVTGRTYDDEKFIEAIHNECEGIQYFSEALAMNAAIPAPLDQKSQLTLYTPAVLCKQTKEARDFYKLLRDEVKYRVDNQIAALATERFRIWHDNIPPWFFLRLFRNMEQFGAACVGSFYLLIFAQFNLAEDGKQWVPARTPKQLGIDLKDRESAVNFYSRWVIDNPGMDMFHLAQTKIDHLINLIHQFHCGAMIMHLNRGCEGHAQYQLEFRLGVQKAGIPVLTYEGNMADKREFDESQTLDRLESFMESLGLHKLDV